MTMSGGVTNALGGTLVNYVIYNWGIAVSPFGFIPTPPHSCWHLVPIPPTTFLSKLWGEVRRSFLLFRSTSLAQGGAGVVVVLLGL